MAFVGTRSFEDAVKPLDLLEQFDKGPGSFGFIATYEFEPNFFERRVLSKRMFGPAERLVIFMDRGRYQELINEGLSVSGFNRRYLVVPISRAPEVFHPKLYLSLGEKRADAVIGSSNCTNAGIGYNVEICSTFSVVEGAKALDVEARAVLRQVFEAMKLFSAEAGPLKDVITAKYLKPVEDRFPWLHPKVTIPTGSIELILSHKEALWEQLIARLKGRLVRKITVIAPFYDKNLEFIERLRRQWPAAALTVVAQPDYATLAGDRLAKLFGDKKHQLFAAYPQPGRRLHAKAFAFETDGGVFWLSGSPNASLAAFDGRNTESAIWVHTKEKPSEVLRGSGIKFKQIKPAEFSAGDGGEPQNLRKNESGIVLRSAVLEESGRLELEVDLPSDLKGGTLRIRNINEALPIFSIPMRQASGKTAILDLDDNQISQIRSAAVCEVKGVQRGEEIVSNSAALVQLYQLLRERTGSTGGRDALRTIEETGENLITFVDSLGSVREAVEFFNNCSIRFFDGESPRQGARRELWRPRDPFKPDTPPSWNNTPVGTSAAELQEAIRDFVERHQREKLSRHVRRGNLNGLPNFLDIFRTLNGLLFTYHFRSVAEGGSVIPFGYITSLVMKNLELLIGPFESGPEVDGNGFVSSIYSNFLGEKPLVRERLRAERVPEMLRAAVEAMVDVRAKALKMSAGDRWANLRLRWVSDWIQSQGLIQPSPEDVQVAGAEYLPEKKAA